MTLVEQITWNTLVGRSHNFIDHVVRFLKLLIFIDPEQQAAGSQA